MKRIFCFLVILSILAAIMLPCNATEYLTEEEAGALINKAVDLFDYIHMGPPKGVIDRKNYIQLTYDLYYYQRGEVKTCTDLYYLVVDDSKLPGGSYGALSEFAKSVYTEDIANSMYNTSCFSYYELEQPMFYKSDSGQLYMLEDIGRDWCHVQPYRYGYNYHSSQVTTDVVDIIYVDSDKATVRYLTSIGPEGPLNLVWVDCYLVNTENGWRITDSPFTKMLRYERYAKDLWEPSVIRYTESPSTGDGAAERATLLGAVSLACLIPAACLTIKRRRRSVN